MVHAPPTRARLSMHEHTLAGARQVSRAGEAVVAGADDDCVPGFGGQFADGDGKPDFAEHGGCWRAHTRFTLASLWRMSYGL